MARFSWSYYDFVLSKKEKNNNREKIQMINMSFRNCLIYVRFLVKCTWKTFSSSSHTDSQQKVPEVQTIELKGQKK